ncbi:MAG: PBP1A family penicillin-binding protein [Bacteroidia bacterium]|nr:PBP1A family penicillin-binding protein [Bacteroidia bacterium]
MDGTSKKQIIDIEKIAEKEISASFKNAKKLLRFNPSFKIGRTFFFGFIGLIILSGLIFLIVVSTDLPPMDLIENPDSDLSTQLISADNVVLEKYYSRENRVNVKLNQVSEHVVNALIATEDVRFYGHSGIDPKSFFTIIGEYLRSRDFRGGSTITMQLSRNLYDEVGSQSTLIRKAKEYLVSGYIERRFTKQEIMEAYLNTVNIYGTSYGIETTANRLFDKSAKDLTIEESALIVGMLKGQGVYNPFRYPEKTQNRRNTIIDQMVKYDFIDPKKTNIDSLKNISVQAALTDQEQTHIKGLAPYFREHVRAELDRWCKKNKKADGTNYNLYTDGLRVYTTIDSRMQAHAENAVREHMSTLQVDFDKVENRGLKQLEKDPSLLIDLKRQSHRYISAKKAGKSDTEIEKEFRQKVPMIVFSWDGPIDTTMTPLDSLKYYARILETGMVSIDPTNGHVKAWVGGIDFKFFKYDHVAQGKRQVGSTFKPFVYGAAVRAGFKPCDIELNQPVVFDNPGGNRWVPKNSDGSIGGKMTLKYALANSVNLVTARLMKKLGPHEVASFAREMGISTQLDEVPALCLGTTDLSVMELTHAYSTFANHGNRIEPIFITRIEDRSGNVLASFEPEPKNVLSEEQAYLIVELLKGVVDQGTAQRLRFRYDFKNEIGGKTGTTQNQSDGWFIGITPNLVTGVWVGAADRRMRFRSIKYGQGANMALPIWGLYMKSVYADSRIQLPMERFLKPDGVDVSLHCKPVNNNDGDTPGSPTTPGTDDFGDFD